MLFTACCQLLTLIVYKNLVKICLDILSYFLIKVNPVRSLPKGGL